MSAHLQRVKEIFLGAVEKAGADERAAFLQEACGGDAALREQVEALLRRHEQAGDFLEPPAQPLVESESVHESASPVPPFTKRIGAADIAASVGGRIGPYKLLQNLGEGGMGVVYLAEQEEPVKRRVALKIIKAGMDSAHVIARFEQERQALAMMDHPNIAKVLDAGATADGRPYFVMELVKGVPITKYCDQEQLTPQERLELFVPVCQAVQHAHQKGVIHRDLKPSNVLIALYDGKPIPKVIDFGVAKAIGQKLTERTMFTEVGQIVGTLEYMSPEQAELNNLDIDTRADIYSLGVILYELLTGSPPFTAKQLRSAAFTEMLRMIREVEPLKPSTKLSSSEELPSIAAYRKLEPKKLTKLVHGDLDWIVMKCLEKERGRRYDTANGLATDILRYLADEPVLAGPPSATYRFKKFLRRNRGPVLAAALFLLALVGGVIGTSIGMVRAEEARQGEQSQRILAEENAERATKAQEQAERGFAKAKEAVEHYLKAVTDDPELKLKHDLHDLRKRLLQAAVPFYEWFTEQKRGEASWEAERGSAYGRLAFVRQEMGEKGDGLKDYERMQAVFAKLTADLPNVPEYRQELAASSHNLGSILHYLGHHPAAEKAFRTAVEIEEKLSADFPSVPEHRLDLALYYNGLGYVLHEMKQWQAAEQAFRQALDILERMEDAKQRSSPANRQELARSHYYLGRLLGTLGQFPAAAESLRRAVEIREKLAADFPAQPQLRKELGEVHNESAGVLRALGQKPAAEQAYRRAMEIEEKLVADFPTVPHYRRGLAASHNNLALLLNDKGERLEAEKSHRRALEIREKLAGDFPAIAIYRQDLATSHNNLALLLVALGQPQAAEQAYRRAIDIEEKLAADFPAVPQDVAGRAGGYVNFGNFILYVRIPRKTEESLDCFAKAIALLEPVVQREPRLARERLFLRNAHWGQAVALCQLKRDAEAVKDWDRVLELNTARAYEAVFRRHRAIALAHAGEHAKAVAEANALADAAGVPGDTLYNLACVYALAAGAVTEDMKLQEQYATRAVDLLRRAVAKGYRNVQQMKKDSDLDSVRRREDFKQLLAELTKNPKS